MGIVLLFLWLCSLVAGIVIGVLLRQLFSKESRRCDIPGFGPYEFTVLKLALQISVLYLGYVIAKLLFPATLSENFIPHFIVLSLTVASPFLVRPVMYIVFKSIDSEENS